MTVLFEDGFDSGDFSAWTGLTGSPSIQSSVKHCGNYGMQTSGSGDATVDKVCTATANCYLRFYVYFSNLPSSGNHVALAEILNDQIGDTIQVGVKNDGGTMKWGCTYPDNTYSNSPNPTTGVWYFVEIVSCLGVGREIFVNGVSVWSGSANYNNCNKVYVGAWDKAESLTVYFDSAKVADTYMGPESQDLTVTGNLTVNGEGMFDLEKSISFSGSCEGTTGKNLGFVQFVDTYLSGQRELHMKGIYDTDSKYKFQWYYWNGSNWNVLSTLTQDKQLQMGGSLELSCTAPYFSTWQGGVNPLEPYLWGLQYYGGQWHWTADGNTLQLGDSFIRFKDTVYPNNTVDVGIIRGPMEPEDPILWISRHLIVKKDFACGGAASVFQGALILGSDWDANDPDGQMPQIVLAHSEGSPYPDNPKRDTLQIWRAGHAGLAKMELDTVYTQYVGSSSSGGAGVWMIDSLYPASWDVDLGGSTNDFNYVYANHLRYDIDLDDYDSLDDLGIIKNYKSKKTKQKTKDGTEIEVDVIEKQSLLHLLDEDGFYCPEKISGFLIGCIKALVLRTESLENKLEQKGVIA